MVRYFRHSLASKRPVAQAMAGISMALCCVLLPLPLPHAGEERQLPRSRPEPAFTLIDERGKATFGWHCCARVQALYHASPEVARRDARFEPPRPVSSCRLQPRSEHSSRSVREVSPPLSQSASWLCVRVVCVNAPMCRWSHPAHPVASWGKQVPFHHAHLAPAAGKQRTFIRRWGGVARLSAGSSTILTQRCATLLGE